MSSASLCRILVFYNILNKSLLALSVIDCDHLSSTQRSRLGYPDKRFLFSSSNLWGMDFQTAEGQSSSVLMKEKCPIFHSVEIRMETCMWAPAWALNHSLTYLTRFLGSSTAHHLGWWSPPPLQKMAGWRAKQVVQRANCYVSVKVGCSQEGESLGNQLPQELWSGLEFNICIIIVFKLLNWIFRHLLSFRIATQLYLKLWNSYSMSYSGFPPVWNFRGINEHQGVGKMMASEMHYWSMWENVHCKE